MIEKKTRSSITIVAPQIQNNDVMQRIDSAVIDLTQVEQNSHCQTFDNNNDVSLNVIENCTISTSETTTSSSSRDSPTSCIAENEFKSEATSKATPASNTTPTYESPFLTQNYTNLTSQSSDARVLFATDEWFATADNLLKDGPPIFVPDLYCPQGKVMDGWESRRRREAGHDWCVIKLGTGSTSSTRMDKENHHGDIYGIEVDTAHFTGNQTPRISIQVANCDTHDNNEDESLYTWMPGAIKRLAYGGGIQGTGQSLETITRAQEACDNFEWKEILPMSELGAGYEETRMHYFVLSEEMQSKAKNATHVRINYFPDGGVARLRLWGHPSPSPSSPESTSLSQSSSPLNGMMRPPHQDEGPVPPPSTQPYAHPELSLDTNGGCGLICSNKHYGVPSNLIQGTYGKDMGDGWETARHPDRPPILIKDPVTNLVDSPLMDWAVLKLGMGGAAPSSSSSENDGGISRIIIDTKHFKGNFPESVQIEGCLAPDNITDDAVCDATPSSSIQWFPLLPRTRMGPDQEHMFTRGSNQLVNSTKGVTHVRVSIFPDGGLSRVRIYGQPATLEHQA